MSIMLRQVLYVADIRHAFFVRVHQNKDASKSLKYAFLIFDVAYLTHSCKLTLLII